MTPTTASKSAQTKRVGIFFSAPGFDDAPFNNVDYKRSYHDLAEIIAQRGGQCFIVRGAETFLGEGVFSRGWIYEDGVFRSVEGVVRLDVLYNKGEAFVADSKTVLINPSELDALCRNKERTIERFSRHFPRSVLVRSAQDLPVSLATLSGDMLVAKPTDSWGGHGVFVGPRNKLPENVERYPALVQEFIDTSNGIPGIVEGTHDLRILLVGGRVALCYVRTPPDGTVVANVAQGGKIILVPNEKIPSDALAIAMAIDAEMSDFGKRVYSVDMGLHEGREWKLFELNPQPGLTSMKWGEGVRKYYELLAEELLE